MTRLLIGIVLGWLSARWYYATEPRYETPQRQPGTLGERARAMVQETKEVAGELRQEAKAGATMEKNSLKDKAQRIADAGTKGS